jgi:hypothetical protein
LAPRLDDVEQFDFEHQHLVRTDRRRRLLAIGQLRRDPELELGTDRHQLQALGPARDHALQRHHRRLATIVGAVEGLAVQQGALVVHLDAVGGGGLRALAFGQDLVLQAGGGGHHARLLAVLGQRLLALLQVRLGFRHRLGDLLGLHALAEGLADFLGLVLGQQQLFAGELTLRRALTRVSTLTSSLISPSACPSTCRSCS